MTVTVDLGPLSGRVLIGGGAYGNLQALTAFDRLALDLGIASGNVIHNGDIAAYCADPAACIALARTRGWVAIKGNVEAQLAAGLDDCGCGFAAGSACDGLSALWYAHADRTLGLEARQWMAGLPDHLHFTLAGRRFTVVHGSPARINRFMFASLAHEEFVRELDAAAGDAVIAGHTGIPFIRPLGRRLWANPGAIGLPANDATPRVWALLLEPGPAGIRFTHLALAYDTGAAARALRAAGLPEGYGTALETGLWPSLDVLAPAERAATGCPLDPPALTWPSPFAESAA